MAAVGFTKGLHEVGNDLYAYLQPDGGWGYSNAGLIVGDGASLLVDTLFDCLLTAEMLTAMDPVRGKAPIGTVVNTHANGDHCFGNQLMKDCEIVASAATAHEMTEVPASMLHALNTAPGEIGELFRSFFGQFSFEGIEMVPPTKTFTGSLDLNVGGRMVSLLEVGPAHTQGDTLVHVPDADAVFTGDILFSGGTPVVWAGPLANWIGACDRIIALAPSVVIPGHGPVSTLAEVRDCREYLSLIDREATLRHSAGMTAADAARDIAELGLGDYRNRGEFGRVAVNVEAVYRQLDPLHLSGNFVELFQQMAALERAS
jgi:cyclase